MLRGLVELGQHLWRKVNGGTDTAHPITGQVQGSGFSLKSCFLPRGPILLLFSEPSIAQLAVSRPSFLLKERLLWHVDFMLFSEPSIAPVKVLRPSLNAGMPRPIAPKCRLYLPRGLHAVLRAIYSTWWSIETLFSIKCKHAASKGSKMSSLRPTWTEKLFSEPSISWKNSGPLFYSMEGCRVQ